MPLLSSLVEGHVLTRLKDITPPVTTVEELLCRCTVQLSIDLECDIHDVEQIKTKAAGYLLNSSNPIVSWTDFASPIPDFTKDNEPVVLRSSGFPALDALFDGGFHPGNMIQVLGSSCSGKTQFALSMAISCAKSGLRVFILNTNNDIGVYRIRRLLDHLLQQDSSLSAERKNEIKLFILSNIIIQPAFDVWTAMDTLCKLRELPQKVDVIVVDCMHSLVAPLLTHSSDKFATPVTSSNHSLSSAVVPSSVHIQPIIASFYAILRRFVGDRLTVMVTNVLEREKGVPSFASNNSNINVGNSSSVNSGKQPIGTGGSISCIDLFDHCIVLNNLTVDQNSSNNVNNETIITANIVLRPPQFNTRSNNCELVITKL